MKTKYCNNKDMNTYIKQLIKRHGWRFQKGKKHPYLISPEGNRITYSATPSDWRALHHFKQNVRHIGYEALTNA